MFESKYGVARHIYINIPKAGSAAHAVSADWTPAAGDVKISKDGGAAANVTNLPTAIAMGNSAIWDFSLTATEMQAAQINITVADSTTKAVDDTGFVIETYGNASALHAVDRSDIVRSGLTALPNVVAGANGGLPLGDASGRVDIGKALGTAVTLDANNVLNVSAKYWAGTAITATSLPVATAAGAANGLPINGSNAAITWASATITGAFSINGVNMVAQTGDNYARIGAPVGASISIDIAAIKTVADAVKAKTDNLPSDPADASDIAGAFTTVNTKLDTIDDFLDTEIAAIKAKTDNLPSDPADASDIAGAFGTVNATLATIAGYIDTEVAAILAAVDTEVAAIKAKTDNLPASPAAVSDIPTAAAVADAVWDEALAGHAGAGSAGLALSAAGTAGDPWITDLSTYSPGEAGYLVYTNLDAPVSGVTSASAADIADKILGRNIAGGSDGTRTVSEALYALRNRFGFPGGVYTVYENDDTTPAWTGVVTSSSSADPITGMDPV